MTGTQLKTENEKMTNAELIEKLNYLTSRIRFFTNLGDEAETIEEEARHYAAADEYIAERGHLLAAAR